MHYPNQYLVLTGQRIAVDHIAAYYASGAVTTAAAEPATEVLTTMGGALLVEETPAQIDSLVRLSAMRPGQPFFSVADDISKATTNTEGR